MSCKECEQVKEELKRFTENHLILRHESYSMGWKDGYSSLENLIKGLDMKFTEEQVENMIVQAYEIGLEHGTNGEVPLDPHELAAILIRAEELKWVK